MVVAIRFKVITCNLLGGAYHFLGVFGVSTLLWDFRIPYWAILIRAVHPARLECLEDSLNWIYFIWD